MNLKKCLVFFVSVVGFSFGCATTERQDERLKRSDGEATSIRATSDGGSQTVISTPEGDPADHNSVQRRARGKDNDDDGPGGGSHPGQKPGQNPGQNPGQYGYSGQAGEHQGYFPEKPRERRPKVFLDSSGNTIANMGDYFPGETDGWEFQSIDGRGNNKTHPAWGAAHEPLVRKTKVAYANGIDSPSGSDRPDARVVSNVVAAQPDAKPAGRRFSDFMWTWGQFLDHDIALTEAAVPEEPFPITVPTGDPFFDPTSEGDKTIPLNRSEFAEDTKGGVRQQVNIITAFVDASNVYGSDDDLAMELRTLDGTGKLKTSEGNLLPFNTNGFPNAPSPDRPEFHLAGDVRANETVGLLSMHTLFVREHNRLAEELRAEHPKASGNTIYQKARSIVAGLMQRITYGEFLPILLGENALPAYQGYNDKLNPTIINVFSTVAYRVGHTMLSTHFRRLKPDLSAIDEGHLALRNGFFNPEALSVGLAPYMRGFANTVAQEIDVHIVDDVRNFLFGPPGSGGFDLASLNIQRGRDHGLPSYNDVREAFGLERLTSFAEITSDEAMRQKLQTAYGNVDKIDPWVGGLAEDKVPGAQVGPMFFKIIAEQFIRLRDGDRFWYQRSLPQNWKDWVDGQTLTKVIIRNTAVSEGEIPANAFLAP